METENKKIQHPLQIYCKQCGSPVGFDIVNQTYRCSYCGTLSEIQDAKKDIYEWKEMQRSKAEESLSSWEAKEYHCPSCGAHMMIPEGEASVTCDFCGSNLIREDFADAAQVPDAIIPFFITYDEARKRMLNWGHTHQNTPEGRSIVSNMGSFQAYYLPYQLVCGSVFGTVTRNSSERKYYCGGYLERIAVNTSSQLDNLILNEMEPFDWTGLVPFDYGYLAGQKVKLNDSTNEEIRKRVCEEATEAYRPVVERTMQTKGISMSLKDENLLAISVLLPVYLIRTERMTAVLNGQTGRIAVSQEEKKSRKGKNSRKRKKILRSETAKASREKKTLVIEEKKDILKNPFDCTPVFYEPGKDGSRIPVRIRFYNAARWCSMISKILFAIFLPAIVAAGIRWAEMDPGEEMFSHFHPEYGCAWYLIGGTLALIYLVKGMGNVVYEHPLIYEILPNGKKHLMGKRKNRKISLIAMFGIGENEKLSDVIKSLGGIGIFLLISFVVLFLGSVAAML
ncbi:MAG: hypothetical protein ACI4EI_04345 [Muricoprocola sp.]